MSDLEHKARSRRGPLLASLALAALALLLGQLYLRRYEKQLSGGQRVPLLFLAKEVRAGSVLRKQDLATRLVPLAYVDERDVRAGDLTKVVGIQASFDLGAQQALQWTDLTVRRDSRQVSQLLVPGKRAVALTLSRLDAATAQLVRPGDYVDVVATADLGDGRFAALVLLQRVLVVAVGDKTERTSDDKESEQRRVDQVRTLTLSLDLDESQLVALAASRGELSIAVRHPDDQRVVDDLEEMRASNLDEARRVLTDRRHSAAVSPARPVRLAEAE